MLAWRLFAVILCSFAVVCHYRLRHINSLIYWLLDHFIIEYINLRALTQFPSYGTKSDNLQYLLRLKWCTQQRFKWAIHFFVSRREHATFLANKRSTVMLLQNIETTRPIKLPLNSYFQKNSLIKCWNLVTYFMFDDRRTSVTCFNLKPGNINIYLFFSYASAVFSQNKNGFCCYLPSNLLFLRPFTRKVLANV